MRFKASDTSPARLAARVAVALSHQRADLVVKNGHILDVYAGEFWQGDLAFCEHVIAGTHEQYEGEKTFDATGCFLVPGFVDAHVHIESSLTSPARFQEAVLPYGTTTALWDPHEIANVRGKDGVSWALESAARLFMDIFVLLPSCVPATHLETSGAALSAADLAAFAHHPVVLGLAEFMNVPGVLHGDPEALRKLELFAHSIRDGHAPQLTGKPLNAYLCAGIQGCHESTTQAEAREKLRKGMHVLVREGSCAKDAQELLPLLNAYSSSVMALCSDDRNPLDIAHEGHINHIINMGLAQGLAPDVVFRAASFGAAQSYGLGDRGVLAPGFLADVCVVKQRELGNWRAGIEIVAVFKSGQKVEKDRLVKFSQEEAATPDLFTAAKNIKLPAVQGHSLIVKTKKGTFVSGKTRCRVMGVRPGQLITDNCECELSVDDKGIIQPDLSLDVLKIAVFERHHNTGNCGVAFAQGFKIHSGAIATSIGHDSHNITTVGSSDEAILAAVKSVVDLDGGIVVVNGQGKVLASLSLPLGGLMTHAPLDEVTQHLTELKAAARAIGCDLEEPFLQLSFLALPVIPTLKVTDKGLVDVEKFELVSLEM